MNSERNKHKHNYLIEISNILIVGIVVYFVARYFNLYEFFHDNLDTYEFLDIDELFFAVIFVLFGLVLFSIRRYSELKKEMVESTITKSNLQIEIDERKEIEEYLRVQEHYSQITISIIQKLEYAVTYDDILDASKKVLFEVLGYKTAWFYRISDDKKTAKLIFSGKIRRIMERKKLQHIEIVEDPYYKRIAHTHEIDIIRDASADKLTSDKSFTKVLKIHSLVHIPLILSGQSVGLLGTGTFGKQGVKVPTEKELEFIKKLSGHIALAFNRIYLQQERDKAEFALKNSEEKYRTLIDQSADAIFLHVDGKYEIVNDKLLEMFNVTMDDINSDKFSILDYTHPRSIPLLQERRRKALAGEKLSSTYEFTGLTKDKREIELETSISYIFTGGKLKAQGIFRDISKRKRSESIQTAIYNISDAANMTNNLKELISKIHLILKSIMYANNFYVALYDEKSDLYKSPYFVDQFDTVNEEETLDLTGSLTDFVRKNQTAAIIDEKRHTELVKAGEAKYILKPAKVWMGAPLKTSSGIFGVLAVQSYESSDLYTNDDLELLNLISGQIAVVIEKRKASDENEKNRKFFETVIDALSNPLYVISAEDYTVTVANKAAKKIIFKDDCLDKKCHQLIRGEDKPCSSVKDPCSLKVLLKKKKALKFEQLVMNENNDEMIYEVNSVPIFDDNGKIVQMIESFVDITERKRDEQKLTELAFFPESNPNVIMSINSKKEITYMNTATTLILGEMGVQKNNILSCFPKNLDELIDTMLSDGAGMENIRVELDNHVIAWSFHPVVGQDCIHCYGHDITRQVKQDAEINKLSLVATQSSNIIMILNLTGIVEYVNPYFTFVTGFESDEVVGKKLTMIKSGTMKPSLYEDLWDSVIKGSTWSGRIENKKKNGDLYWESKTISPIFNYNGKINSYISIGTDITNEIKLQKQLVESEKFSAIATLAAGVAHEFKNYLGGIIGNASFSLDEIDSPDGLSLAKETLTKIIDMGEKANDVAMSLLTFSKAKSEDRKKEDMKRIIIQSIKLIEKELDTLSIEVALHFDEVSPIDVSLSKIQQLLLNLFINAKHAIGKNGVITIALLNKGDRIEIRIGDSGGGIAQENLDKIFDPFFSTKGVWGNEKITGTGMGLSICRNLAREHNGDLTVDTVLGIGSVFTISLPISKDYELVLYENNSRKEKNVIFFTLNHFSVTNYYDDACNCNLQLLQVDNFEKIDKSIINSTEIVICDAKFSAKLELYRFVEFCIQNNQPYVMVNCGTMEYQLSELYDNSIANYKEFPDFYKIMNDYESYLQEKTSLNKA